jgi:serine/threonine protein kinase
MTLMMDDISRIMRGSLPQNLEVASAGNELGMKARVKGSDTQAGSASADTKWSRGDAKDFDGSFKIYKRIRGDKDMIDWDETVRNGKQIGEGSFGTVMRVGNVAHKRGEVSANEANIIKKAGELGIGPRLLGAEISTKKREGYGVDLHEGRIAMSVVPGKQMGDVKADTKVAGKNVSDIYWKAMADLHRAGIAHNDAHVENILIDNKGKGRWVDFGLAQDNPRAALAEAMGSFKPLKGGDDITIPGSARGNGNWQARGWDATGYKLADSAKERGGKTWEEYKQRFPVASRVWSNQDNVVKKLERMGLDTNDINSMIEHGIRSPLSSYNQSQGFSRITDRQAQDLLNTLYDGI